MNDLIYDLELGVSLLSKDVVFSEGEFPYLNIELGVICLHMIILD